jgi:hypothetical protein
MTEMRPRVCVFRKALRHKDQGHFKDTTWTSADDDGDPSVALRAMEGRLRTVNDLRFSHLVIRNRRRKWFFSPNCQR